MGGVLTDKPVNFEGVIKDLVGEEIYISRLRDLGFVRGETVVVRGYSPFGGPVMVEVRGAVIALRRKEAECIQI